MEKSLNYYRSLLLEEQELSDKQKDIAKQAAPKDKITGADFKALQKKNENHEGQDHEVSMATNSLKSIISAASQLMDKLGSEEKDIPAWIQDHITNAENYISHANKNYHEYEQDSAEEYTDTLDNYDDNFSDMSDVDSQWPDERDTEMDKSVLEHILRNAKPKK